MKLWASVAVLVVAGSSLVACGGVSAAAAKSCAAGLENLERAMNAHPGARDPQVARAARASFTQCGSAAFWTVPAKRDDIRKLISTHASLDDDLRVICGRYDRDYETPVCEDRHENG